MKKTFNIKEVQKRLAELNEERSRHIFSLVHGLPMIHGLPQEVFRRCGKTNCKCSAGRRHGPYTALSVNKDGKQKIVMVRKKDAVIVTKKSRRYRYYQQTLAKIRKINREIDKALEEIKTATIESYP